MPIKKKLMLIGVASVVCLVPAWSAPVSTPLIAGQHTNIGTVTINNDLTNLTVTYNLTGGATMSGSHLAVACTLAGIPQKNGNPPPGQFPYQATHNPPVTTYTYTIPLSNLAGCNSTGSSVYIAAHADTNLGCGSTTMSVKSAVNPTNVTRKRLGTGAAVAANTFEGSVVGPFAPVLAWKPCATHPNCPDELDSSTPAPDPPLANNLWDVLTGNVFANAGANWVWATHFCDECVKGEVIRLETPFNVPGTPTSSNLIAACDNGFQAKVNSTVVTTQQVSAGFRDSDLREANVNSNGWQNYANISALPVISGANTLVIDAANEYEDTDDNYAPRAGNRVLNPAGCAWVLTVNFTASQCGGSETAWGQGAAFSGSNWAMYLTYRIQ